MKIIFLDIDGPMIPATSYLFDLDCSWKQVLNQQCVDVLKEMLKDSGARIVFNTTHNRFLEAKGDPEAPLYTPGLRARFLEAGFTEEDFHMDDHTLYPDISRLEAINEWLSRNGTEDTVWCALDDAVFNSPNLVDVDANCGLTLREYNEVGDKLGYPRKVVLL